MNTTRIVATYGPACRGTARVAQLLEAGVDVVRINCSHGSPDSHLAAVAEVRQAAACTGRDVSVLADLPGPKMRMGALPAPLELRPGEEVALSSGDRARQGIIPVDYSFLAEDVRVGGRVLLRDGLVDLTVREIRDGVVSATVTKGGVISSRQGVSLPGSRLRMATPTAQDLLHAERMLEAGVDYLALSFVRTAEEVECLRAWINAAGRRVRIVAKIEHPEALDDLEGILHVADAVMVARGDLGVEMGFESVPLVQKRIIAAANAAGVPVITATELLDSMVHSSRPTRAEASDVVNAVLDGTDAVMLSAETAAGDHPVEAVQVLRRLCQAGESGTNVPVRRRVTRAPHRSLAERTRECVRRNGTVAVATFAGQVARALAMARVEVPIVYWAGLTADARRYALYPGLRVAIVDAEQDGDPVRAACAVVAAAASRKVTDDDRIVVVSAAPDLIAIGSVGLTRTGGPVAVAA